MFAAANDPIRPTNGACGQHVGFKCRAGPSFTERSFARRSTTTYFESETTTGRNACNATIPFRSWKADAVVPIKVDVANVQPQNKRKLKHPACGLAVDIYLHNIDQMRGLAEEVSSPARGLTRRTPAQTDAPPPPLVP